MTKYTSNWFIKLWSFALIGILFYLIHMNLQIGSIYNDVGFWVGLWDGLILPLKWIKSIFGGDVEYFMHPNPTYKNMYIWGFMGGLGGVGVFKFINIGINLFFSFKK